MILTLTRVSVSVPGQGFLLRSRLGLMGEILMAKPSKRIPERKLQVVLSVLRGKVSVAEAAGRPCG